MIDPAIFIGQPISFKDKCLVYPPTVKEVISDPKVSQFIRLLTLTDDDLKEELLDKDLDKIPTPLEYLLINCYHNKDFKMIAEETFQYFIHQPVTFLYEKKAILIGQMDEVIKTVQSIDDLIMIEESDYFDFQNTIRRAIGRKEEELPELPNPNEDPRVTRIKEKARMRDRIKAKKGNKDGLQISTCLTAICCMGIGLTPLNIGEMSYASINAILSMYQDKEKYHIDIDSIIAGADSKKVKPKYWIRNSTD